MPKAGYTSREEVAALLKRPPLQFEHTPPLLKLSAEKASTELVPGEHMPDGTVYAGVSPDTNRPMYTTRRDVRSLLTFAAAKAHAENMNAHGHADWRVPTKIELAVLFNNRAAIGHFKEDASSATVLYWSSTSDFLFVRQKNFRTGETFQAPFGCYHSVRCVRG